MAVTGVAKLRAGWLAEVVTDAGAFLLASGQPVPGTAWHVEAVDSGRVTLARPAERSSAAPITRSYAFTGVVR